MPHLVGRIFSAAALALFAAAASGDDYPNRPIRILTAGAGGGVDFGARLIAQGLSKSLGQPVVVENRGGSALLVAEPIAKAPPDGYNLLFYGSALWLTPFMRETTPYDPLGDFAPISLTNRSPNVLVVHPSLPVTSVKELIALARGRPGALNFSSSGMGSGSHLAGELFNSMAGVKLVHVPYKSNAAALVDLLAGQIQLMFSTMTAAVPLMQARKLKALAVTSAQPSALHPDLPTVAATVPGYVAESINALFAPAKTPEAIVNRLYSETLRILGTPEAKERLASAWLEPVGSSPEQLTATMKSEMGRLGNILRNSGARAD